jgi:hypothetical protein
LTLFKILIFIFLVSCSSTPKKHELESSFSESHPSCKLNIEKYEPPFYIAAADNLFRGIKSTGSYTLATIGYTSDTVFVGGGVVALGWLCLEGHSTDCGNILEGYVQILKSADIVSLGNKAYSGTSSWRCPYVDHITSALREVAACNSKHSHYIAAFAQLDQVEMKPILKECISNVEKLKVEELRSQIETETLK